MTVFAFIFARGGSVGLPGKNIKFLGGHPLIAHSIQLAQQFPEIKKVIVSTDSEEIASVATSYSAQVIMRPPELASHTAPEWLAWQHAIRYLHDQKDYFDVFLSLPTTSPLRSKEDVQNCLAMLCENTDMVITVTPSSRSPYFNMITRQMDGCSMLVNPMKGFNRRQDVPATFDVTTVAYVSRPAYILQNDRLFSGRVKSVIIPKERAVDIDDAFDFKMAEMLFDAKGKQ